jgi:hypothetical protein
MKLTKPQAKALQEAQSNPECAVHFERANDVGMTRLEEAGLVIKGWLVTSPLKRGELYQEAVEALKRALEGAELVHPESAEVDAMQATQCFRALQRERYYLTDLGHMMANLTRQGRMTTPEEWEEHDDGPTQE